MSVALRLYNSRFMVIRLQNRFNPFLMIAVLFAFGSSHALSAVSWDGVVTGPAGKAVVGATVKLHSSSERHDYSATTSAEGKFTFDSIAPGSYDLSVTVGANIVNFGLPSNIVNGSGFGIISKTAGSSRQFQFSVKMIY